MKIVDLSIRLDDRAYEEGQVEIERISHKDSVRKLNKDLMSKTLAGKIKFLLGSRIIKKEDLPDEEFLSVEIVHAPSYAGTHLGYSFRSGSTCEGRKSKTADEIPIDWCFGDAIKINAYHRTPGEVITAKDVEASLKKIDYKIKLLDIVLLYTGCDKFFGTSKYFSQYPGVSSSAIKYLLDRGVKVIGVDSAGIDRPSEYMIKDFMLNKDPKVLWPAHFYGRKREFVHIERLTNLDKLPDKGFKIACFPVRIRHTGAAWSRVVAFV